MIDLPSWQAPCTNGTPIVSGLGRSALKAEARAAKAAAKVKKKKAVAQIRAEVTDRDKVDIIARDEGICMLCLTACTVDDPPEVDHVRPASQFPRKCESNMACLHRSCNIAKGARTDAIPTILRNMAEAEDRRLGRVLTPEQQAQNYEWRNQKAEEDRLKELVAQGKSVKPKGAK